MARTTGYSHRALARLWLEQSQPSASGKNMSFDGREMRSWWTPIARICDNGAVIISNGEGIRYSTSTKNHIRHVWSACHDKDVDFFYGPSLYYDAMNLASYHAQYQTALAWLTSYPVHLEVINWHWEQPRRVLRDWQHYCEAFGLPALEVSYDADIANVMNVRLEKLKKYSDPKNVEKRLRASARRELMRLVNSHSGS